MSVEIIKVDRHQDQDIFEAKITSETGVRLNILSYGARLRDWCVPVRGEERSLVLGHRHFRPYVTDDSYLGAIIGRVANRIGGSRFCIADREYFLPPTVGEDHLHGGPQGIAFKNWRIEKSSLKNAVVLHCESPAGEMGYPGRALFSCLYQLNQNRLRIEMRAEVSELTPISMVQHNYFNLSGEGLVLDHQMRISASRYTPLSESLITTGEIASVEGTLYDFRKMSSMRENAGGEKVFDINFVFDENRDSSAPVAFAQAGGLELRLWTDRPGMQLYNGAHLNIGEDTLSGKAYRPFSGFCFEDQNLPNAVNRPQFPSVLAAPDKPYRHWCEIEIK
jgi:aldose 1-epimerase